MNCLYEMEVRIRNANPEYRSVIENAMQELWCFGELRSQSLSNGTEKWLAFGQDHLCGGQEEQDFADDIAKAIWDANLAYCEVEVRATCLEYVPCETYTMDEEEYERLSEKD